ncbi:MAG: V-type ATP synthase subunit I [Candidatus Methanospirareceae archaeon]
MLRPAAMKKVRIVAMKEFKDEVIKRLHTLGVIQITEYENLEGDIKPLPADPVLKEASELLRGINEILEVYEEVRPEPSESFFKRIFNPSPPKRIELGELRDAEKEEVIKRAEAILHEVKGEIEEPLKEYRELERGINELKSYKETLERIKDLEVELKYIGEGIRTYIFLGICSEEALEAIIADLEEVTASMYYFDKKEVRREEKGKEYACVVACFKEHAEEVLARLRRDGFEKIEVDFKRKPGEEIVEIEKQIEELEKGREGVKKVLAGNAEKRRDELLTHRRLLSIVEERAEVQRNFGESERTFVLSGWVPADNVEEVSREVESVSEGLSDVEASSPGSEEEDVPVLLRNPRFFRSFELLTKLYGTPKYGGIDPTVLLTPTFLLFFAFMLTDAFYGLICLIMGILLLRGAGRYNATVKDASIILASAGLVTILLGALTGGWFGDLFTSKYLGISALNSLIIIDPLHQATLFLVVALLIGLIHVDIGVLVHIFDSNGVKEILGGDLWFLLAQAGLIPFLINRHVHGGLVFDASLMVGAALLAISLGLLFYSRKGMFLFGITGFLGDILSYARLMALGLCTFGIAMAVNALADMCLGIPFIGYVIGALVFIFGHLLNWAVQVLGSLVHGIRLHYVEFFTKFYKAGGYEYSPFKLES